MLDQILSYPTRGWAPAPMHHPVGEGGSCRMGPLCAHAGKPPLSRHGLTDATKDEAVIREWWRGDERANIAIVTGAISGFFVVDIDPRHGGGEKLAALEAKPGPLPATGETNTGGGGRHILFRQPPR